MVIRREVRLLNICQVLHMFALRDPSLITSDRSVIETVLETAPGGRYAKLMVMREAQLSPRAPTCDGQISRGLYSVWWESVEWVRTGIIMEGGLMSVQVSGWMPPKRPWATVEMLGTVRA